MLSFNSQALISESITLLNGLSSKLMQRFRYWGNCKKLTTVQYLIKANFFLG